MESETVITHFAPVKRSGMQEVMKLREIIRTQQVVTSLINAVPEAILILNQDRQILYGNKSITDSFGLEDDSSLVGRRLGEFLKCIHAASGPGGCGTSEACSTCGAIQAVMESLDKGSGRKECRITTRTGFPDSSLELNVWSTSFQLRDYCFLIFSFTDVSHEKRRQILERIFFHDILNTAGGLKGFAGLLKEMARDEMTELAETVYDFTDILVGEIKAQQQILHAENKELVPVPEMFHSLSFLSGLAARFGRNQAYADRNLEIAPESDNVILNTDQTLLSRVVANLVQNALEASVPGETVRAGCSSHGPEIEFWVNNPAVMSRPVQLQVFQRSFSTKGRGRGLGTYSVKLLGERYLKGKVSFASTREEGTTFRIRLPIFLGETKGLN